MTDRAAPDWTDETIRAYATLYGLDITSDVFAEGLRAMAQKAADTARTLPRSFAREDQPAFAFIPGLGPA